MGARFEHAGAAAATTLTTSITNVTTSIAITSATGWPTGSVGAFWVTIDRGNASEEKVLVTSRSGTTLTVSSRGADGTTATSHVSGAAIEHTLSATELDNTNLLDATITGLGGSVVTTSAAQTLTGKTLTAPTLTAPVASGSLTGFGGAWTAFTPTIGGAVTSAVQGRYVQVGKTVVAWYTISFTSVSTSITATMPVAARDATLLVGSAFANNASGSAYAVGGVYLNSTTQLVFLGPGGSVFWNTTNPFTWINGASLTCTVTYEAA